MGLGEPVAECLAGGGGSGALVSPGRPTCPPRRKTFFYFFLKEKNEIYSRSRKLEANFRCTTFFLASDFLSTQQWPGHNKSRRAGTQGMATLLFNPPFIRATENGAQCRQRRSIPLRRGHP